MAVKAKLAEMSFNKDQKAILDLHRCDLSDNERVKSAVLRAAVAVGVPMNLSEFKRTAVGFLRYESVVVERLHETKPDEGTRTMLIDHLFDCTFAKCLKECMIKI
jgi:hypothetical protein